MNLDMPVYASDLASGYSQSEVTTVKDLLLGAPWKTLEADGFIRDNGHNFFGTDVTDNSAHARGLLTEEAWMKSVARRDVDDRDDVGTDSAWRRVLANILGR